MKISVPKHWGDYILIFLFLCISGNPAFTSVGMVSKLLYVAMLVLLLVVSGFRIKRETSANIFGWSALLILIFGVQLVTLGHITILGSLNFWSKLLCAMLIASLYGRRFAEINYRVMSWICIVSLFFFAINLTGIRFPSLVPIQTKGESLLIYTQTWINPADELQYRNSGMFWEPGAFAGYIIASMLLFIDDLTVLWKEHNKETIIMIAALLTTTSTTGYIAFTILIFYYVLKTTKNKIYAVLTGTLLLFGVIVAFTNLDFLGEKIQKEVLDAVELDDTSVSISRFGSMIADAQYIASHPLFGNGLEASTRFRFHSDFYSDEALAAFSNGFSGVIASMGALFFLVFAISILCNRTLDSRWMLLFMVILLLQGEYFLNYPFFMLFPFLDYGSERVGPKKKIRFIWNAAVE